MAGSSRIVNTPSQAIPESGAAHTQRTVSNSAVALLDHTLQANTTHLLIQFTGANCRVTFDGTNPTTTKGFIYLDGATAYWTKKLAQSAKGIRADGTDVVLEIQELNYL